MKRLVVLITVGIIICFAAVFLRAQNNNVMTRQMQEQELQCTLLFGKVLDGSDKHLERFNNKVEFILEMGFFWERCLAEPLKKGEDVIINYLGYTKDKPTKEELKYLIKSAVTFKEELEDYVEEQEPKFSPLHYGDKYIALQTEASLILPKTISKVLKKENKKFNISDPGGKIFINIMTDNTPDSAGNILIKVTK